MRVITLGVRMECGFSEHPATVFAITDYADQRIHWLRTVEGMIVKHVSDRGVYNYYEPVCLKARS